MLDAILFFFNKQGTVIEDTIVQCFGINKSSNLIHKNAKFSRILIEKSLLDGSSQFKHTLTIKPKETRFQNPN